MLGNDLASLAAFGPDYRNDSGAGVSTEDSSDLLVANLEHLGAATAERAAAAGERPWFRAEEDQALARFQQAATDALDEGDSPSAGTGAIGWPRMRSSG
jgi:hypothetical protein